MRSARFPFLLLALAGLGLLVAIALPGCDFFGDGDGVQCFSGDPPAALAPLDGIPGKVVFYAKRVDAQGREIDGDDRAGIYVLEDGRVRLLVPDSLQGFNPAWSPDGTQVAFASGYQSSTLGPNLYLIDADGSNPRFLKQTPQFSLPALIGADPAWSPDGTQIAFSWCFNCEVGGGNYEIEVVKDLADSTFEAEDLRPVTDYAGYDAGPKWSPNGKKIAFTSHRNERSRVYVTDATASSGRGSGARRLMEAGNAFDYTWSPSGDCVLASQKQGGEELLLLDAKGDGAEKVQTDLPETLSSALIGGWPRPDMVLLHSVSSAPTSSTTFFLISPRTGQIRATATLDGYDVGHADWFLPSTVK